MKHALLVPASTFVLCLAACGGDLFSSASSGNADANGASAGGGGDPAPRVGPVPVDLLFVVDNSASMADKHVLLGQSIATLVHALTQPGGAFPAVADVHLGIVSSSLGGAGSDACAPGASLQNPSLPAHVDDRGHLVNRRDPDEQPVAAALPGNFLTYRAGDDVNALAASVASMVVGVHESGCGFEAQLESWYRFLVQPDPSDHLVKNDDSVGYAGIDSELLRERAAFLRPDSVLGVVVVSDENDSTVDPLSFGQRAWLYEQPIHVKSGTTSCAASPLSVACRSCYLVGTENDPACGGAMNEADDPFALRMFQMRRRFGVDPQFPLQRYVDGLTSPLVPNVAGEHPSGSFAYDGSQKDCTNPIYAASLPTDPTADLCHLPRGPRAQRDVFFAVLGGVPADLVPAPVLDAPAWTRVLGADPGAYDFTGMDPRMRESIAPRAGVAGDFDDGGTDLQFACTFPLAKARDCTAPSTRGACDCAAGAAPGNPLCDATTPTLQVRGKAYPAIRELAVARALGTHAVVASICADPTTAYRAPMASLVGQMAATKALGVFDR